MNQLSLELAELPAPHTPADWGACQEWNANTGRRCTGRRIHSVTTTSPALVGFGKTTCSECKAEVVL